MTFKINCSFSVLVQARRLNPPMSKYSVEVQCRDVRGSTHARWTRAHPCVMDGLCYSQRPPHSRLVAIQRTGPAVLLFLPALRALDFGPVLVVMLRLATLVVWICVWFVWLQ